MHRALTWLLLGAAVVVGYTYYQNHSSQLKAQAIARLQEAASRSEARDREKDKDKDQAPTNTVVGPVVSPLADLMAKADGSQTTSDEPTRPWKAHPNDHISPSPVGTGGRDRAQDFYRHLHRTISLRSSAPRCQPATTWHLSLVSEKLRSPIQRPIRRRNRRHRSSPDE